MPWLPSFVSPDGWLRIAIDEELEDERKEEEEFDPTDEQYDRWRAEQDLLGES